MTTREACDLLVEMTHQCAVANADRDLAIAERDATHLWLRASMRCNIELTRNNDRLQDLLRQERANHADLRASILERGVAA
jgi:hypothetical protein